MCKSDEIVEHVKEVPCFILVWKLFQSFSKCNLLLQKCRCGNEKRIMRDDKWSSDVPGLLLSTHRAATLNVWVTEMQKVKTFTLADFWGPKNLRQKCVIRDKFNAIKSAWFATNWILKRLKKHYLCSKFKKKTEIIFKVFSNF